MTKAKEETFRPEVIDEILKGYKGPEDFWGLIKELKKAIIIRSLEGEMECHLGYGKHDKAPGENRRNPTTARS